MGGGWVLYEVIKLVVMRPRPANCLISTAGWSFPSGHATMATIFFLLLVYLHRVKTFNIIKEALLLSIVILLILLVGISRIYLGVHWLSDVFGGYALGSVWVIILALIHNRLNVQKSNK